MKPETAFVSPTTHFSSDWRIFQTFNRQKKGVKFAYSGNPDNPSLKFNESIYFSIKQSSEESHSSSNQITYDLSNLSSLEVVKFVS